MYKGNLIPQHMGINLHMYRSSSVKWIKPATNMSQCIETTHTNGLLASCACPWWNWQWWIVIAFLTLCTCRIPTSSTDWTLACITFMREERASTLIRAEERGGILIQYQLHNKVGILSTFQPNALVLFKSKSTLMKLKGTLSHTWLTEHTLKATSYVCTYSCFHQNLLRNEHAFCEVAFSRAHDTFSKLL